MSRDETLKGMTDKNELEVFGKNSLLGGGRQTAKQIDITVKLSGVNAEVASSAVRL